jgi:hypothetical protein
MSGGSSTAAVKFFLQPIERVALQVRRRGVAIFARKRSAFNALIALMASAGR